MSDILNENFMNEVAQQLKHIQTSHNSYNNHKKNGIDVPNISTNNDDSLPRSFSSSSIPVAVKPLNSNNINNNDSIDKRERVILMLLQRLCSISDPTPKTFLSNVMKLHSLGLLSNINFLQSDWLPNPNRLLSLKRSKTINTVQQRQLTASTSQKIRALSPDTNQRPLLNGDRIIEVSNSASSISPSTSPNLEPIILTALSNTPIDLLHRHISLNSTHNGATIENEPPVQSPLTASSIPLPSPSTNSDFNFNNTENNLDNLTDDINEVELSAFVDGLNMTSSRYSSDFIELERVGQGGFGTVNKCMSKLDGCVYAIKKIIFNHRGISSLEQRKIFREVRCLAKLNDRNIVRYYNAWLEPVWETNSSNISSSGSEHNISNTTTNTQTSANEFFIKKKALPLLTAAEPEHSIADPATASVSYGENTEELQSKKAINNKNKGKNNRRNSVNNLVQLAKQVGIEIKESSQFNDDLHQPKDIDDSMIPFEFENNDDDGDSNNNKNNNHDIDTNEKLTADSHSGENSDESIDDRKAFTHKHHHNDNHNNHNDLLNLPDLNTNGGFARTPYMDIPKSKSPVRIELVGQNGSPSSSEISHSTSPQPPHTSLSKQSSVESITTASQYNNQHNNHINDNIAINNSVNHNTAIIAPAQIVRSISGGPINGMNNNEFHSKLASVTSGLTYKLCLYIQTQYCLGQTLLQYIHQSNRLISSSVNMPILAQILNGLAHIHKQNIIHRDLKPANLFVTTRAEINATDIAQLQKQGIKADLSDVFVIKLGDFGLAKLFQTENEENDIHTENKNENHNNHNKAKNNNNNNNNKGCGPVGTLSYAAPEQINGAICCDKSDIYSVGVILFELYSKFSTNMERSMALSSLRKGVLGESFTKKWPEETRLILAMCKHNANQRPSAYELLNDPFVMNFAPKARALHQNQFKSIGSDNKLLQLTYTGSSPSTNNSRDFQYPLPALPHELKTVTESSNNTNNNHTRANNTLLSDSNLNRSSALSHSLSSVALDTLRNIHSYLDDKDLPKSDNNDQLNGNSNNKLVPICLPNSSSSPSLLDMNSTANGIYPSSNNTNHNLGNSTYFNRSQSSGNMKSHVTESELAQLQLLTKPQLLEHLESSLNKIREQQLLIESLKMQLVQAQK